MSKQATSPAIIADHAAMAALAGSLASARRVAIDTEFVRERTYYPKLCLVQVATDEVLACVDCLAGLDLEPLFDSLFRPDCEWVLHSARQDLEIFWNASGRMPARLFDTQLAAALLGAPPQIGLSDLVARELGIELDKSLTRTDWSRRPIAPAALAYALDDVRYLLELAAVLCARLVSLGRESWYAEDAARALATPPVTDPVTVWQKLKGLGALGATSQAAALALVRWREAQAKRLDRPRRWILADDALIRIARELPSKASELRRIGELPKRLVDRSGREMIAAVAESRAESVLAEVDAAAAPKPDKTMLKALQDRVKARAEALHIHSEVLATRREIAALAAGESPPPLIDGWRAAALAE